MKTKNKNGKFGEGKWACVGGRGGKCTYKTFSIYIYKKTQLYVHKNTWT